MAKSQADENLIEKITNHSVRVTRDGKSVRIKPGTVAGFTQSEIDEIEGMAPGTFRDPVNESSGAKATPVKGAAKGGKTADTAGKTGGDAGGDGAGDTGGKTGDTGGEL